MIQINDRGREFCNKVSENFNTLRTKHHDSNMKLFKKRPKPHKKTYDEFSYDNCADSESLKIS